MTLNTKIEVFKKNFCRFSHTFQERIAPQSIEIGKDKLRIKFPALNVNFDGPHLDFLRSRKPAHESIKKRYPRKVVILPLLASLLWKRLQ